MLTTTVAGRTWNFSHPIGCDSPIGGKGFFHPTAVAVAPGGILYVLNRSAGPRHAIFGPSRIGKLTIEEEFLGDFGQGGLVWPAGLALDHDSNVYCSDEYHNLIKIYDPEGKHLGEWGETGSEDGQLSGPSGLAFDSEDDLYVVDSLNDRVQKLAKDGRFLLSWGSSGGGEGQLNRPWGITIDGKGDVYVADWGNNRVQKFSPDGAFLMRFGSSGPDGGDLNHPSDVAVDSEGDVYVTDWGNKRVQIYDPEGDIITALYGGAMEFSKWAKEAVQSNPEVVKAYRRVHDRSIMGRFNRPRGIAVDEQDRIIVVDSNRHRLQVYAKEKDYMDPQFNL